MNTDQSDVMYSEHCIYCGGALGPDTQEAHIIPSALGGKLRSRLICCSECNNAISPFEKGLCDALRGLTAMAGVRTGRGKRSPPLRVVDPQHGPVDAWGGHPTFLGAPPDVRPAQDGQTRFHLHGGDIHTVARDVAHLLRRFGKTPDDLEAGKGVVFAGTESITFLQNGFEFDGSLDLDQHARVFVKMPLELLAVCRPLLARRPELRVAATFSRYGTSPADVSADTMTLGPLGGCARPFWHSCEVWSAGTNLIGKVVLFGAYPVSVALSAEWRGEPVTAVHVVDPVTGRVHLHGASSEDGPLPAGWPMRGADLDVFQAHMNELGRALRSRMREVTIKASAKALMRQWVEGLNGRTPGNEDVAHLNKLIEDEGTRLRSRRSESAPLNTADLLRRVREEYERMERVHGPARKP